MLRQRVSPLPEGSNACFVLSWARFSFSSNGISSWPFRSGGRTLSLQFRSSQRLGPITEEENCAAFGEAHSWEDDILKELDPLAPSSLRSLRRRHQARPPHMLEEEKHLADWTQRARDRALLVLQARDPHIREEGVFSRRRAKKKVPNNGRRTVVQKDAISRVKSAGMDSLIKREEEKRSGENGVELPFGKGLGRKKYNFDKSLIEASDAAEVPSAQASSLSKDLRRREYDFNKSLLEANDAEEVLNMVQSAREEARTSGLPSVMSPVNISTALHRIARHMERCCMLKTDRLSFARQREMAELVTGAMVSLPDCSAQGLSNIAWALSKVGGSSLYSSEMDHIASLAMSQVEKFNSQNIANIAGSYASMQHSVTSLFTKFDAHAAHIAECFRIQELSQFLWAFASFCQPPTLLLDALDEMCLGLDQEKEANDSEKAEFGLSDSNGFKTYSTDNKSLLDSLDSRKGYGLVHTVGKGIVNEPRNELNEMNELIIKALFARDSAKDMKNLVKPLKNALIGQLANIVWSYAVLNQIGRPSFTHIWQTLVSMGSSTDQWMGADGYVQHVSQIYQTNLSLQLEYPHLGFSLNGLFKDAVTQIWDRQKSSAFAKSVVQKEVKRLLVSTGYNWVVEYTKAYYSLDIALVEKKIGIEIDGPSHFTRNTGKPLGHTILKRRLMTKAGWTLMCIPFQEWEDLDGEAEHKEFLKNILRAHL